jgi:hypothetical protein
MLDGIFKKKENWKMNTSKKVKSEATNIAYDREKCIIPGTPVILYFVHSEVSIKSIWTLNWMF